jgi:hypothetical protein
VPGVRLQIFAEPADLDHTTLHTAALAASLHG